MCPLSQGEEIEELRYIVSPAVAIPVSAQAALRSNKQRGQWLGGSYAPDGVVAAFFSEACPDSGALLLDDGSLVGDGLGGANVADELLD